MTGGWCSIPSLFLFSSSPPTSPLLSSTHPYLFSTPPYNDEQVALQKEPSIDRITPERFLKIVRKLSPSKSDEDMLELSTVLLDGVLHSSYHCCCIIISIDAAVR